MTVCRLFGIPIKLHWSFLLLLGLFATVNRFIEAIILFATVFLHEVAHAVVARRCGLTVTDIQLLPFGGVARIDGLIGINPFTEMKIAFAGPLFNGSIVGIIYLFQTIGLIDGIPSPGNDMIVLAVKANAWIGGLNCVPAMPLDGGRIARAALVNVFGFIGSTAVAVRLSRCIALVMIVFGLIFFFIGKVSATFAIVGLFVYVQSSREEWDATYAFLIYMARKRFDDTSVWCRRVHHLATVETTPLRHVIRYIVPTRFHMIWIIDRYGKVIKVVSEGEIIKAIFEGGTHQLIGEIGQPVDE